MDQLTGSTSESLDLTQTGSLSRAWTRWAALMRMTRPSVVALVFFTGVPMLALAGGSWPAAGQSALLLLGVALAAGASSVFNAWVERDLDARMDRTRKRPLPAGIVQPDEALFFGLALTAASMAILMASGHPLGALIAAATIAFYVFVYTIWLKPRTPLNIVIGGAAGAAPPLIIDAALTGSIGAASMTLFTLVFLWTPPHFWAIALFRKDDYAKAGFPMLPITHGDKATRNRMVLYALSLIPVSLVPVALGQLSLGYAAVATTVGGWFAWRCINLWRRADNRLARGVMGASLLYLFAICAAMTLDLLL